ncbi:hypothetical protein [Neptunomonas marina]|uniref:Uncharacterized protein n=1 Tax=Neptunomonas marina TaxID=1815562 RepID=A0A437QE52_9GAMM|nr:hypothetical protein [Neptunomonas marina]RVU32725.1 hypothetical protein EOE65_03455 [Neptunomonas marina]
MNGLLQSAQQKNTQQPPQAAPKQGQMDPRQVYEGLVSMMLDYLYSESGVQMVQQSMQIQGQPHENIGMLVARLIQRMFITAKTQKVQVQASILFSAGMELSQAVADMYLESGAIPKEQGPKIAEEAFYKSIVRLAQETSTEIFSQQERQDFQRLMQKLKQMKTSGQQPQQAPSNGGVM